MRAPELNWKAGLAALVLVAAAVGGAAVMSPDGRAGDAAAASEADPAGAFERARADFDRGRAGDGAAVDRAAEAFARLAAREPGQPLLLAYEGSAVALQARYALAPWNKMKYAERGMDMLDKSLALLEPAQEQQQFAGMPVGLVTRLLALNTFVAVPSFFHRMEDARDLLKQVRQLPAYGTAPAPLRAEFAMVAALIARNDDQRALEAEQLRQVVALAPASPVGLRATARLQELGR